MMSISELDEYSKGLGFTRGQAEKDYMQYHALLFIGRNTGNELVFKGGTCLQKVFSLDRFSEDLDFTKFTGTPRATARGGMESGELRKTPPALAGGGITLEKGPEGNPRLAGLTGYFEALGYPARTTTGGQRGGKDSFRMLIEGPLFDGGPLSRCSISINISFRGDLVREPVAKRLVPPYAEIPPLVVRHMDVGEILAEKVRALMTRDKARDLYDIHFLLMKGIRPDRALVDAKLDYYDVRLTKQGLRDAIASKKRIWKRELSSLLASGPVDFDTVSTEVLESMNVLLEK